MKILFVENREKTLFWEKVALSLLAQGHQIGWIVQNHIFHPREMPSGTPVYVLPYPKASEPPAADVEAWVRAHHPEVITDRGRAFFGAGAAHYDHYRARIGQAIEEFRPDLVIGESTLFHELITIGLCRAAGILYVQPMGTRYPRGRFSLLAYDTQVPAIESGDSWTDAQARDLAQRIASGTEVPAYMRVPGRAEKMRRKARWALSRGRIWWARVMGERYNTPSIAQKYALQKVVERNTARWSAMQKEPQSAAKTVLYPMQLQPESNVDVWGRPYSDQVETIRELLSAAPGDYQIAVKANPKAKYELNESLFELASNDPRICLLPFKMGMPEALANCVGAVTVTGTVGFEAICGKGRAISLRHPIVENEFPDFHAESPSRAVERLLTEPQAGVGNVDLGAKLIKRFVNQTFVGRVADPFSAPECIAPHNVQAVSDALILLDSR